MAVCLYAVRWKEPVWVVLLYVEIRVRRRCRRKGFFFFFFSSFHAEQIIRVRDVTFSLKKGGREWTSIREVRQSGVALHRHSSPRTINVIHIYTHLA